MNNEIRHEKSGAAAAMVMNIMDTSPGAPKCDLFGQILFVIRHAMDEAFRKERDNTMRRLLCTGCWGTLNIPPGMEGRRVKCPRCGTKQRAPEKLCSN